MFQLPYVADRSSVRDAETLIASYGATARNEATARAGRSRDIGNHIHFCHWRQVARLVDLLSVEGAIGTVH